jgi:type 1 glutamine amidotransferase
MRTVLLTFVAVSWIAVGSGQIRAAKQTGSRLSAQDAASGRGQAENALVRLPAWGRLRTAVESVLGWRIGVPLGHFREDTFEKALAEAYSLGVSSIEGHGMQKVSIQIPKNLDYRLAAGELRGVQERLTALRMQMPVYLAPAIDGREGSARKVFEFAKSLNVETVAIEHALEIVPQLESLADEYDIKVALKGEFKTVVSAVEGRGQRLGTYADFGPWMEEGISPVDALARLKQRAFVIRLSDRSALGRNSRPVALGSGVGSIAELLNAVHRLEVRPSLIVVDGAGAPNIKADLFDSLENFEQTVQGLTALRVAQLSREIPIKGPDRLTAEEREHITAAVPQQAIAKTERPRRLLVFDANIAYGGKAGGHRSIPAANLAIERFAKSTGAYEPVFSNDLENFKHPRIKQFDAVFLNNTVGAIFVDPEIRESLIRFVLEGGGLAGYHGTSHASMDWPRFGEMLGAIGGSHREPTEIATVRVDDPSSPLVAAFANKAFVHQDEFYRFAEGTPSRNDVRVLMSIDVEKTDMNQGRGCGACARSDNDYPLTWVRSYGEGRVFYTALGHAPSFFMRRDLNEFFFAGLQFALGDLKVNTAPNGRTGVKTGSAQRIR